MTPELYFLLGVWIVAHLLVLFSIRADKGRHRIFILISILLAMACVLKPYTYDLKKYVVYFETGHIPGKYSWKFSDDGVELDPRESFSEPFAVNSGYEKGFRLLAKVGNQLIPHGFGIPRIDTAGVLAWEKNSRADVLLTLIMIVGIIVLFSTSRKFISNHTVDGYRDKVSPSIAIAIILGSIFFLLGSQNTLRQFLGVLMVVSAGAMFVSRKYVQALAFVILAGWLHRWAPILGFILFPLLMFSCGFMSARKHREILPFRFHAEEWYSLLLGIFVVIAIKAVVVLGLDKSGISYFNDLGGFVTRAAEIRSEERWSTVPKALVIFGLFFATELLVGRTTKSDALDIRMLRRCVFLFVVTFAFFSEIFSRLLILYWAIEVIFLIWTLNGKNFRARIAGSLLFITYGLAPNGLNVLTGPVWHFWL